MFFFFIQNNTFVKIASWWTINLPKAFFLFFILAYTCLFPLPFLLCVFNLYHGQFIHLLATTTTTITTATTIPAYLASGIDVMSPVVGSTAVASLTDCVWRTDTLSCSSITVITHMAALAGCKKGEKVDVKWLGIIYC